MTIPVKKIKHKGILLSYNEAADHFGVSYAVIVFMWGKGMTTTVEMQDYRDSIDDGSMHRGGRVAVIYDTSKGKMTIPEMARHHPHILDVNTIRNRGDKWGFDHKCMWMPKMAPKAFYAAAVELDGPPRGEFNEKTQYITKPNQDKAAKREKKVPVNRLKCCLRDKGRERCKTYALRLKLDDGIPEPCSVANGNTCKNYEGERLGVMTTCGGRGVKHFGPNGTPMCLR